MTDRLPITEPRCLAHLPNGKESRYLNWCEKREQCARAVALRTDTFVELDAPVRNRVCLDFTFDRFIKVQP